MEYQDFFSLIRSNTFSRFKVNCRHCDSVFPLINGLAAAAQQGFLLPPGFSYKAGCNKYR